MPAFCEGLQQVITYAVFGFDGICLWQIFSGEVPNEVIKFYDEKIKETIEGFGLPLFFLATKPAEEGKFNCSAPGYSSYFQDIDYFVQWLGSYFREDKNKDPLLRERRIKERGKSLGGRTCRAV